MVSGYISRINSVLYYKVLTSYIEVDRAVDNLVKSGKMFAPQRRDSLPVLSPRGFPEHGKYFWI